MRAYVGLVVIAVSLSGCAAWNEKRLALFESRCAANYGFQAQLYT